MAAKDNLSKTRSHCPAVASSFVLGSSDEIDCHFGNVLTLRHRFIQLRT